MTDPSTDPVGTVRQETFDSGHSLYAYLPLHSPVWDDHKNRWTCIYSTHAGNVGEDLGGTEVEWLRENAPVIGAVPGTPAAEPDAADDEVAVERMARALHRGAWERDIANGTPLEGNDVDVCWSKVGAKYREWYYADARAALAALRGERP